MADLKFSSSQTGKTVTAKLIMDGSQVGSDITLLEGTVLGEYTANIPSTVPGGSYVVLFYYDGTKRGSTQILWDGTKEVDIRSLLRPSISQS